MRKPSGAVAKQVQSHLGRYEQRYEKKVFIVAELGPGASSARGGGRGTRSAEEPELSNELVDGRLQFAQKCASFHWQFNDLRHAQWSTMMILAHLGGRPEPLR